MWWDLSQTGWPSKLWLWFSNWLAARQNSTHDPSFVPHLLAPLKIFHLPNTLECFSFWSFKIKTTLWQVCMAFSLAQSVTNVFEYSNIRIYWTRIYIQTFVRINFSFTNIFGHSFVSNLFVRIYSNIRWWVC